MAAQRQVIAFVSDSVLPFNKGGKEARIHHLTQGLSALGHDVHIYTMQWWKGGRTLRHNGITYHAISNLYPLYAGNRRSIKQGVLFGLACLKMLRYSFDVVEVDHMPYFPLYTVKLVSLLKRRPMYATWHEVWGPSYWKQYLGRLGLIAALIERCSVWLPDTIIAVSPQTAQQLRAVLHYHGPLSVVANGIDYNHIEAVTASTTTSDVLYAGRLLPHKNVAMLIHAVERLRSVHPAIKLLIVGDGPERASLQQLVQTLELEPNVSFTGFVATADEVYSLMKATKVFVLPSVREGFGIAALEAAACGLPVVTVDHPDNAARHLIPAIAGCVCKPSVTGLSTAIRATLTRPDTQQLNEAANFDWSHAAQAVAEVYAS